MDDPEVEQNPVKIRSSSHASSLLFGPRAWTSPLPGAPPDLLTFFRPVAKSIKISPSICHLAQGRRRERGTLWPEATPATFPYMSLSLGCYFCSSRPGFGSITKPLLQREPRSPGTRAPGLISALPLTGCVAWDKSASLVYVSPSEKWRHSGGTENK